MKKMVWYSILFLLMMSGMAQATLTTIGTATYNQSVYNLIWDNNNNGNSVVWLDYTNPVSNWSSQLSWAAALGTEGYELDINLYDGYTVTWDDNDSWRLPTASELTSLFEVGLGLVPFETSQEATTSDQLNATNFDNLIAQFMSGYWSSTETSATQAYYFNMVGGNLRNWDKTGLYSGLAVRNAQVTPIPGTVLMLGAGLLALSSAGRKRKETFDHSAV